MRIVDVRTYVAPPPAASWLNETQVSTPMSIYPQYQGRRSSWRGPNTQDVYIEVVSDEGLSGLGVTRGGIIVQTIIDHHLRALLLGMDHRDVELIWEQLFRATLAYGRKGAPIMAISGVDLALWDLLAKWMGQPLYRLLGGAMQDSLPVYATHPNPKMLAAEGYVGTKIPMAYGLAEGRAGLAKNVERVAQVREAVGADVDVMVDCWMSWDVRYTLEFAQAAREYRVRWIEEPLPPDDYDGYTELRRRITGTQVATGEHEYTRWGFKELLDRECADILQPDVAWSGGISEIRRVAAMAAARGIPVIPHNGVMQPWATHLMLATPNCPLAEHIVFPAEHAAQTRPLMLGELVPQAGRVRPSDMPGAGVSFDVDEWRRQTAHAAVPD
jgi:L-rhamnonate dehydratase